MSWDTLLLHQKIAIEGPRLTREFPDYLNKIKVKELVQTLAPAAKIARLVRTFRDPAEFTAADINPAHILKASRGSGTLRDLATVKTPEEARGEMSKWIRSLAEPPEFLIEEKIKDAVLGFTGNATDYKFFCFNGEPKFFLCRFLSAQGRWNRHFYDLEYRPIKLEGNDSLPHIDLGPMIEIARKLSARFPFVRIDLYNSTEGVYFGEFTFHVCSGKREFDNETELRFGKLWDKPTS
jgi:hypothetical protein